MMGWFRALMPKDGRFFDQFEGHARTLVGGADALQRLLAGGGDIPALCREIVMFEHQADDITRDVLRDVRRTLITPFDRSMITALIAVMDDAIDQMNDTATAITLYEVTEFQPEMQQMATIIVNAASIIAVAVPLLRDLAPNATTLNEMTEKLVRLEGQADDLHDAGLKALFKAHQAEPMRFIIGREIYSHLEKVVDRFEDVANEIQGLVIDFA